MPDTQCAGTGYPVHADVGLSICIYSTVIASGVLQQTICSGDYTEGVVLPDAPLSVGEKYAHQVCVLGMERKH